MKSFILVTLLCLQNVWGYHLNVMKEIPSVGDKFRYLNIPRPKEDTQFAVVYFVSGYPNFEGFNDELLKAIDNNDWKQVQEQISGKIAGDPNWPLYNRQPARPSPSDDEKVKPKPADQNTSYYEQSEFTFHESTDIDGQKPEQSGRHNVIIDNGVVTEYHF